MREVYIDLHISADEYIKRYQGISAAVVARARDGRRIQFPANILQPFVSHAGINGSFRIVFDDQGKFKSIDKL